MATPKLRVQRHTIDGQHVREYARGLARQDGPVIEVKQYTPLNNLKPQTSDITIIGAGGIGMIKELYEPFFEDLVAASVASGFRIRNIWMADMAVVGASATKNEKNLGNDPSWWDHSRDLLAMVNHFRSEMHGPLVGIGHSMGGAQIAFLSILHPRLFSSLILIDPAINDGVDRALTVSHIKAISQRPEVYPSREIVARTLKKSPFTRTWNQRVLDKFVENGFISVNGSAGSGIPDAKDQSSKAVRSTTLRDSEIELMMRPNFSAPTRDGVSRPQKWLDELSLDQRDNVPDIDPSAGETYPFYRPEPVAMYRQLEHVRPPVLFVAGGHSLGFTDRIRNAWLARTGNGIGGSGGAAKGCVKLHLIEKGKHTLPFDDSLPELVDSVGSWLADTVNSWMKRDESFQRNWDCKSAEEKRRVHPIVTEIAKEFDTRGRDSMEHAVERKLSKL